MRALAIMLALLLAATAATAGNNPSHKTAVHIKSHPTSCIENYPSFPSCSSIQSTYGGCGSVDVLPVFYELHEYTSVEFGLTWVFNPSLSMVWTRCKGDVGVGTISHSGDGTIVSWATCQHSYSVAPGYGWLTVGGPELIYASYNPTTGRCGVIDCQALPGPYFDWSSYYGAGGLCGTIGDDPCVPVGLEGSTWGAVKALIR